MQALRQRAELLAAALPPLMVAAERVAATVAQGVHGRRRTGVGDSFWQYRSYQPTDPSTAVDWRQSAKRDRLYVRQNEWEAAESVWLWADGSPSMNWRGADDRPTKLERAAVLTLALSSLLVRGGERIALLDSPRTPATGKAALDRIVESLALRKPEAAGSLPALRDLPRFARVVMISDFLSPLAEVEALARGFAAMGVDGHLVQVLDPAELELPFEGRVRFDGLEGEGSHVVPRVELLVEDWHRRMEARRATLADFCRRAGWSFSVHRTDHAPQTALLALYAALGGERALRGRG